MLKWKYGNYQFTINPNSQSSNVELIGDDVRTLSGALISQPTTLKENYDITSTFFQPRSRALSQMSVPNAISIELYNNQFYVLNRANDRIDIYNRSFTYISSVSLSALTNKSYISLDAQSDGFWVLSSDTTSTTTYKTDLSGALLISSAVNTDATSIKVFAGYVWILRRNGAIDKLRTVDLVGMATIVLPYGLYYSGLSTDGNYLIVGNNDDGYSKIYHINSATAEIINQITFEGILYVSDIVFDGLRFYVLNGSGQFQSIIGNTVETEIYDLKNEIRRYGFVNLVDDMGVSTRVFASNFSCSRRLDFEHMYDVSMAITKVNRG